MQSMEIYQPNLFVPTYAQIERTDWRISIAAVVLCKGYWSPARLCLNMAALLRRGPDGQMETWMSTTPMELESQELGCLAASGHVVVMGMGMGWAVANTALNPAVTRVTVVEYDPTVLAIIRELGVLEQLPAEAQAKIQIVQGDAYDYRPDQPVDLLMPDIWLPLMNDTRLAEVGQMAANCQPKQIYFWGQEMEIARHARARGIALDDTGVRQVIDGLGLPLLVPAGVDYPALIAQAAENWMRDRWLPAVA
jgi:hypothetical protein